MDVSHDISNCLIRSPQRKKNCLTRIATEVVNLLIIVSQATG
jgi:hypothetical protein